MRPLAPGRNFLRAVVTLLLVGLALPPDRGDSAIAGGCGAAAPAPPRAVIDHRRNIDFFDGTVRSVAFSPDGKWVAAGGDRSARLFDAATGDRLQTLKGHAGEVNAVAFSPDGGLLASGSRDKTVRVWEAKTGKPLKVLKGGDDGATHVHLKDLPVASLAFLPDGKRLVSCGTNNYVTVWDLASGLWELKVWTNHADKRYRDGCYHLAVSPDGRHCAVAGGVCAERHTRQVSLFEVDHGLKPVWNGGHDGELAATHVAFANDGGRLVSCGQENAARIWDVKTGRLLGKLTGPAGTKAMQAALFTPDGRRVVGLTREGTLCVWACEDGKLLASVKAGDKSVLGLALAPDGRTIATCGADQCIQLWDLDPGVKGDRP